jgi:hypothetical protein
MRARIARGDVGAERLEAIQVGAALWTMFCDPVS